MVNSILLIQFKTSEIRFLINPMYSRTNRIEITKHLVYLERFHFQISSRSHCVLDLGRLVRGFIGGFPLSFVLPFRVDPDHPFDPALSAFFLGHLFLDDRFWLLPQTWGHCQTQETSGWSKNSGDQSFFNQERSHFVDHQRRDAFQ